MRETMRSWHSPAETGIAALRMAEVPVPAPQPDELLVRVERAALNFSDLLMIDGKYQIRPERPFIPGQEIAGTVVAAGDMAGSRPGDRVAGKVAWGGFAEYALMRGDMAISLPGDLAPSTAVALPVVYTTAMVALTEEASLRAGHSVLIHAAAGGVGLAAVQIARAASARVFAAATGAEKCAFTRRHGAGTVIDYAEEDFAAVVRAATGGRGVDVIFDSVGGEITARSLRCLAWRGQLLIVGFSSGEIPAIPAHRLLLKRAVARGIYWDHDRDATMITRVTEKLLDHCRSGSIRPVVDDGYAFADLPRALDDLAGGGTMGKLALRIGDDSGTTHGARE